MRGEGGGDRFPGWTYGRSDDYYDMRMYVGKPLSAGEMLAIASAATPKLWMLRFFPNEGGTLEEWAEQDMPHLYRCTPQGALVMKDSTWTDIYDHRCGR